MTSDEVELEEFNTVTWATELALQSVAGHYSKLIVGLSGDAPID
jgi:hypothetical protein